MVCQYLVHELSTVKPRKLEHPRNPKMCSNTRCVPIYQRHMMSVAYFLGRYIDDFLNKKSCDIGGASANENQKRYNRIPSDIILGGNDITAGYI